MYVKYALLAVFGCSLLWGCGGGRASAPAEPVGTEEPLPDPQQPRPNSQDPTPNPQDPQIGVEEPLPNAQDPQIGGEGGASPGDP